MDSNLVRRVVFAVVAIPLGLAVIWYGGLLLAFVVAVISVLGTRELFDLVLVAGSNAEEAASHVLALYAEDACPKVAVGLAKGSEPTPSSKSRLDTADLPVASNRTVKGA